MKWGIERCFALSVVLAASLSAAELETRITVFAYNYAGVPGEVEMQAEKEAERIYQHAGGSFATVANVFSHDAEELARRRGFSHGVMLGHLMAHELGHLILGVRSHSVNGIMHVPWQKKELEIIAQGSMLFTSREAQTMRTNIRVRCAADLAAQ
jgi:hypothetical protein